MCGVRHQAIGSLFLSVHIPPVHPGEVGQLSMRLVCLTSLSLSANSSLGGLVPDLSHPGHPLPILFDNLRVGILAGDKTLRGRPFKFLFSFDLVFLWSNRPICEHCYNDKLIESSIFFSLRQIHEHINRYTVCWTCCEMLLYKCAHLWHYEGKCCKLRQCFKSFFSYFVLF